MVWLNGGAILCFVLLLSAIFCYSGYLDFLVRLIWRCYFVLLSAILESSATPIN